MRVVVCTLSASQIVINMVLFLDHSLCDVCFAAFSKGLLQGAGQNLPPSEQPGKQVSAASGAERNMSLELTQLTRSKLLSRSGPFR